MHLSTFRTKRFNFTLNSKLSYSAVLILEFFPSRRLLLSEVVTQVLTFCADNLKSKKSNQKQVIEKAERR